MKLLIAFQNRFLKIKILGKIKYFPKVKATIIINVINKKSRLLK